MKVYAVIPSGGKGTRAKSEIPKQYLKFNDKELIAYTLDVFQKCDLIDQIVISAEKVFFELIKTIIKKYNLSKVQNIIEGGAERQYSVFNAVKSISADQDDIIVIHDVVRPLLSQDILINSIKNAQEYGSSVVAIKAKDTLIKGIDYITNYIDRDKVYYVQTPQVFKFKIYYDAMIKAEKDSFLGTDESILVKRAGYDIKIVEGSGMNFKITNQDDINLFEIISKGLI